MAEILLQKPLLIDLPVAKTHAFYRMSGAIKNLFGLLPAPIKLFRYHTKGFADWQGRVFLDIFRNFPPHLVILDAAISGEGYCPVAGRAKPTGFILTADDALAADLVLARIMGFREGEVPYLRAAAREGMAGEPMLFGVKPEAVVTGGWGKARLRLWGLLWNFIHIIRDHRQA